MSESAEELVNTLAAEILNPLVALMFAGAVVYFIFGVINYIANADSEDARETGKRHLLYSVVGLVIMAGVWGIIGLIFDSLGLFGNISPPPGYSL
jgi:NADH:ubiquinone oxidoreductase subunit 6 (subunit J)